MIKRHICVYCIHYNKERRNADGLARCSKHPFWVKKDDTCDSFKFKDIDEMPFFDCPEVYDEDEEDFDNERGCATYLFK